MTTTIETSALDKALRTLKLSGMLATIDARLAQARAGDLGHIDFLQVLCKTRFWRLVSATRGAGGSHAFQCSLFDGHVGVDVRIG